MADQISQLERIQESTKPGEKGLVRDFTVQACGPEFLSLFRSPDMAQLPILVAAQDSLRVPSGNICFENGRMRRGLLLPRFLGDFLCGWLVTVPPGTSGRHSELPVVFVRRGQLGLVSTCALLVWVILWKAASNKQLKWSLAYTLKDSS